MVDMNKDGDGPYIVSLGYFTTICMGYGSYKGG